jgi:alkylation response protein AidB-like acyl-CoA dehydrogenase
MEHLYTESQIAVRDMVRRFAETKVLGEAAAIDRDDRFPHDIYRAMADLGLFGAAVPEAAGGSGFDTIALALAMEELARCSGSVGNILAVPVEAVRFLHDHGDAGHKALIPDVVSGKRIPATCVSEPDHGSDVAGIKTIATRDGDHYVINGTKAWVSLGQVADLIFVFAKTDRDAGHRGISCLIVDGDNPGVKRGRKERLLGMHGLATCQIVFEDCRVPAARRIGPEHGAFKMAMVNFNFSRILMAAMALGMTQAAFEDAMTYARSRIQFGNPIFEYQAVQFMLADMSTDIAAARLLIHHGARLFDAGHSIAKEAAHLKLFTTDMAMKHVTNALQIHGGNGYSQEYRIERIFRDVKLPQIYEGTNQIQRLIIARQLAREMA